MKMHIKIVILQISEHGGKENVLCRMVPKVRALVVLPTQV